MPAGQAIAIIPSAARMVPSMVGIMPIAARAAPGWLAVDARACRRSSVLELLRPPLRVRLGHVDQRGDALDDQLVELVAVARRAA